MTFIYHNVMKCYTQYAKFAVEKVQVYPVQFTLYQKDSEQRKVW